MLKQSGIEWQSHAFALQSSLVRLVASDCAGAAMDTEEAFRLWRDMALEARAAKKTLFLIGNGASASMASHFYADLCKNAQLRTEVFTDMSLVTALGNDLGYDQIFAVPIRFRLRPGDMVVAISSSGESANVLAGVQAAREKGGYVVTISAMDPGNSLRALGDLNFWIPADTYGLAETGHAAVLHFWMDRIADTVDPVWD